MTNYSWTHPKKRLVWCLASANGNDVSSLKWGGDETYAEVLFELLAKSPTFLRRTASDSGAASFASTMFVSTFKHSTAGGVTRQAFAIKLSSDGAYPPGAWNIRSVDLVSGSPWRLVFQASRIKQLIIVKISFVWSVVKTSDDVVYGWKTLSSYRGEPLTMQRLPTPASPCPISWPTASGSSPPHLITVLSFALAGQKSVQTYCMPRHSSIVSASLSTVAARHNKSRRRGIIASGPFSVLPIGATFLSSFLSLRPVFQYMRCLSIISSTSWLDAGSVPP